MFIDDTPSLSILELRAKARRELRSAEKGIIIVDYLQLMSPPQSRKDGNRAVEVGEDLARPQVLAERDGHCLSSRCRSCPAYGWRCAARSARCCPTFANPGSIEAGLDIVMFIDRSMDEIEGRERRPPRPGARPS